MEKRSVGLGCRWPKFLSQRVLDFKPHMTPVIVTVVVRCSSFLEWMGAWPGPGEDTRTAFLADETKPFEPRRTPRSTPRISDPPLNCYSSSQT
jgi:hypothetical protein